MMKIWYCKIGECTEEELHSRMSSGADLPMRIAVEEQYEEITGKKPDFIFSGWGAELTEGERAVVNND
jgi:hypothetical protein